MSASYLGAGSFLAITKEALKIGYFSILIIPIPAVLSLLLSYSLWEKLSKHIGKTIGEILFENSFLKNYVNLILLWYLILLTSSQIIALIKIKKIFFNNHDLIIYLLLLFVLFYTLKYGLKGVVLTDKFQLFLILPAAIIFFYFTDFKIEPSITYNNPPVFKYSLMLVSFTIAWTISPVTIQRVMAVKNKKNCFIGSVYSSILLFVVYSLIISSQIHNKKYILDFSKTLPSSIKTIFIISLLSAIISTLDTMLNTSSYLTKNILKLRNSLSTLITFFISSVIAFFSKSILNTLGLSSEIIVFAFALPFVLKLFNIKHDKKEIIFIVAIGTMLSFSSFWFSFTKWKMFTWPYSIVYFLTLSLIYIILKLSVNKKI